MTDMISRKSYTEWINQITEAEAKRKNDCKSEKRAVMWKRDWLLNKYNELVETMKCFDMHISFSHENTFKTHTTHQLTMIYPF